MSARLLLVAAGLAAIGFVPLVAQNLEADLQRAMQREATSGDCKSVLPEYERISKQGAKSNRAVAAEALLRTGLCHEREGRSQDANAAYARVTSEFADVTSMAAQASAKANAMPNGRGASASQDVPPFKPAALDFLQGPIGSSRGFSVSPDGRVIAYDALTQGLGLHTVARGPDRFLSGVSPRAFGPLGLVWSIDSTRIVVHSLGSGSSPHALRVVTVSTGKVETLDSWPGPSEIGISMSWSSDGQFVGYLRARPRDGDGPCGGANAPACVSEIRVVSASGATPPEVVAVSDFTPTLVWSPKGHDLAHTMPRSTDVFIVTAGQKAARTLTTPRTRALVAWTSDNSLWSVEPSQGSLSYYRLPLAGGDPIPATAAGDNWIGVTPDGTSVLVYKPSLGRLAIRRAADGTERPLTTGAGKERQAMLSRDGRLVFFASNRDGKWAFYVVPVDRAPVASPVRLAQLDGIPTDSDTTVYGHWSAQSGLIITSTPYREFHIARVAVDPLSRRSIGAPERLTVNWGESHMPAPSPDGQVVAYNTTGNTTYAIAVMDSKGSHERIVLEHDRAKLRWRSPDELLYSEGFPQWGIGPAFHTLKITTGAKGRPAFPDLPIEPARDRLINWDYLPATDEILFVTGVAMPNPNAIPRTGPYTFRVHSLRDGHDRVIATRDRFDYPNGTVSVSADGRFAAFMANSSVNVMDLQNPAQDRALPPGPGPLISMSWSPDSRHLLGCNLGGRCFVIAIESGQSWPLVETSPTDPAARWFDARWAADGASVYASRGGVRGGWFTFQGVTYDAVTKLTAK